MGKAWAPAGAAALPHVEQDLWEVSIDEAGYHSQVVRIPAGASVRWTSIESLHSATSLDNLWDSGLLEVGDSYEFRFEEPGVYEYECLIHSWVFGTVIVVPVLAEIEIFTDQKVYRGTETLELGVGLSNFGSMGTLSASLRVERPAAAPVELIEDKTLTLPADFRFLDPAYRRRALAPMKRGLYRFEVDLESEPGGWLLSRSWASWAYGSFMQQDWSGGPVAATPASGWDREFEAVEDVSWRSIPGQLALASNPLPTPIQTIVAGEEANLPNSVACGDLDGDGVDEIISTDPVYKIFQRKGAVHWWREEGGEWVRHVVSDDFYGAHHAIASDVDGDGDQDVVACAYYGDGPAPGRNGRFAWFENLDGVGGDWRHTLIGNWFWGARYVATGDLDGDGDLDVLGAHPCIGGKTQMDLARPGRSGVSLACPRVERSSLTTWMGTAIWTASTLWRDKPLPPSGSRTWTGVASRGRHICSRRFWMVAAGSPRAM